jgi:diaminopimelate dehydrogenase
MPVAAHVSELGRTDAALICTPVDTVVRIAHDLVQREVPVVECAEIHGADFDAHLGALRRLAARHRVPVIVGAGWDPGALSLMRGLFAALVPKGRTDVADTAGIHMHHTTFEQSISGVKRAMSTEVRSSEGKLQRYVYVEPEPGVDFSAIEQRIREDTRSLGTETFVFPLDAAAEAQDEARGSLLRRHGDVLGKPQFLLFEARVSETTLAARMMVAAALAMPALERRCYTIFDLPLGTLCGATGILAWRQRWI